MRRLVLMRHAKSDWSVPVGDRQRPITDRGRRQAREAGEWLADQPWSIDLAVVSPAARAAGAWEIAAGALGQTPPVDHVGQAYTFDGEALSALVRAFPPVDTVVLVGHNPALEELLEALTGQWVPLKTSAIAVVELDSWTASQGQLVACGRPPARRRAQ